MHELFRFLLSRPANLPAKDEIHVLDSTFLRLGAADALARRKSLELLSSTRAVARVEDLKHWQVVQRVLGAMPAGVAARAAVVAAAVADGTAIGDLVAA